MAFNNSLTSRLDDLRSKNPQATSSETNNGYTTPSRYSGSFMTSHSQPSNDARASLQRRFTTDLSKMSTLTPIGQQPGQALEPIEISSTVSSSLPRSRSHPFRVTLNTSLTSITRWSLLEASIHEQLLTFLSLRLFTRSS